MTDELFFDGARYISAADAGDISNLTRDYIARLARSGKIVGKQVGRQWYVSQESLRTFLVGQEYSNSQRRGALVRERQQEYGRMQVSELPKKPNVSHVAAAPSPQIPTTASVSGELHNKLANAAMRGSTQAPARAPERTEPVSAHLSSYAVPPTAELLHKVAAAALALALVVGLYSAEGSLMSSSPEFVPGTHITPESEVANVASVIGGTFGDIASVLESGTDALLAPLYGVHLAGTSSQGVVAIEVIPSLSSGPVASSQPAGQVNQTIVENNPIVERVVQSEDVVPVGGVTESELQQQLQQLENKLTGEVVSSSAANSTVIAQNYLVTAQTNAIDQLTNTTITNPSISGGFIANASISGGSISGATISGASLSGTTTAEGIDLSGGCFAVDGTCLGSGGAGNPGGSDTEVQFNQGGVFNGSPAFTFSYASDTLSVTNASTTNASSTNFFAAAASFTSGVFDSLSATVASITGVTATNATTTNSTSTNAYASSLVVGNATTTNLYVSGELGLGSPLPVSSGGTGTSSAPSYGELLIGNGSGGFDLVATSSLDITGAGNSFGYPFLNNATSTTITFLSGLLSPASTTIGSGGVNGLTVNGNSTTTGNVFFSGAVTLSGATTTASSGFSISSGCFAVNGTCITSGGGGGGSSNVSTSSENTWSALQIFAAGASTTQLSVFNDAWFGATATSSFNSAGQLSLAGLSNAVLSVNGSGQVVATTSIGTNLLTGALATINGTTIGAGSTNTITAASSTLLANNNTFTGSNSFTNNVDLGNNNISDVNTLGLYNNGTKLQNVTDVYNNQGLEIIDGITPANRAGLFPEYQSNGSTFQTGEILVASSSGAYYATATSSLGLPTFANIASAYPFQGTGNSTSTLTQFNSGLTAFASSTIGNGNQNGGLTINGGATTTGNAVFNGTLTATGGLSTLANLFATGSSTLQNFTGVNATTSQATTSNFAITSLANTLLAVNGNGTVVATSTIGNGQLANSSITINGTNISLGGSATITAASSTLLANNNTWTGLQNFSNATSTLLTATTAWIGTLNLTNALTPANGGTGITSTPSYGTILVGNGTNYTLTATSSLGLATAFTASYPILYSSNNLSLAFGTTTANSFSQLQTLTSGFISNASSTIVGTFTTTGTATVGNVVNNGLSANQFVYTNGSKQEVSVASSSLDLPNTALQNSSVTVNGTNISLGGSGTVTAASSTLLGDNNTFSGNDVFKLLNLSATTSSLLATNASGEIVATTSIGTNLLAGTLGVGNGGTGINSTPSYGTILVGNGTNYTLTATSSLGLPTFANLSSEIGAAYPFQGTGNSTSTITQFNGGLTAYATSTIGNGTQTGGLTISGGATTTGNAVFNGTLNVSGLATLGNASTTVFSVSGNSYLGTGLANTFAITTLSNCTGSDALQTNGSGSLVCGLLATGGSSTGGGWVASSGATDGTITEATSTYLVAVGATSTPYAQLSVLSGSAATTTLALVPASGQTANILDIYNTSGALGSVFTAGGNLGLGTTSPSARLSVNGTTYITGTTTLATTSVSALTIGNATTTANNGFNITTGCFAVNGTCLSASGGGGGSGTVNSGTAGQFAFYNTTGTAVSGTSTIDLNTSTNELTFNTNLFNYADVSTTTIPNNDAYAWTIATSTTAEPLFAINTNSSSSSVSIGSPGSNIYIGDTNSSPNLIFQNSGQSIETASGGTINLGAGSDVINLGGSTTTASNGFNISAGCFAVGGNCLSNISLSGANTWIALQTFSGGASTTNISASGEGYFGTASTTNLYVSGTPNSILSTNSSGQVGALSVGSSLSFSSDTLSLNTSNANSWSAPQTFGSGLLSQASSTFTGSLNANGGLSVGGSATSTFADGINITAGCFSVNGTCLSASGGSSFSYLFPSNATSTTLTFNAGLLSLASTTIGNGTQIGGLTISGGATTTGNFLVQGNTTLASATSTNFAITNLANALLSTNGSGSVIASTSIGTNLLSGTLATINTTAITAGGTFTITAASSTLLANNNTFSGNNIFTASTTFSSVVNTSNASTSLATLGTLWLPNITSSLLSTNPSGQVAAASVSYPLQFSSGSLSLAFGTTTANTFSNLQTFASGFLSQASSTVVGAFTTTGTATVGNVVNNGLSANQFVYTNGNKQEVSVASSSLDLPNSALQNSTISNISLGQNLDNVTFNNSGSGASSGSTYDGGSALTVSYNTVGAQAAGTYLTGLGNYSTTTGTAISFSTSTITVNGQTLGLTIVPSANALLFTPTLSGTLGVAGGGTGQTTFTSGNLLYGAGTGALQSVATSSLAVNSTLTAASGSFGYQIGGSNVTFGLNLTNANNWTGLQQFANASSTLFSVNGQAWFGGTATSTFLGSGTLLVGTTTPPTSAALYIAATSSQSGTNLVLNVASSTGTSLFSINGNGLITQSGIANSLLAANGSGQLIASTSIGTNLLSGTLATINTTAITAGGTFTITAASSTLLGDNNTFSGTDDFTHLLIMTNGLLAIASSTIGNGTQIGGLTISGGATTTGSAYVGGTLGIGTTSPYAQLAVFAGGDYGSHAASTLFAVGSTTAGNATTTLFSISSTGTTTAANGFNIVGGCFSVNGNCLNNISLSGANTWTALQTFSGGASTTNISASGEGYFGTASTTNLYVSGTPNSILSTNSSGQVGALSVGSSLSFSSDTLSLNTSNANSWSAPQTFGSGLLSQASSTFTGALNVNGGLSVGGATSTFANGITLTSGCVFYNGSCIGANAGYVGSGTQGQFAFYATNGTTVSGTSTLFVTQSGNIGIGTTNPGLISGAQKYLTIQSTGGNTESALELSGDTNVGGDAVGRISFYNQLGTDEEARISSVVSPLDSGQGSLVFSTGYDGTVSEVARFDQNGDLGIGTTTPWARLSVDTTNLQSGQPEFAVGSSTRTDFVINQSGNVGIGTTSPGSLLSIGTTNGINFSTGTSTFSSTGGINLTSGCFSVNGTCLSASGGSSFSYLFPSNATSTTLTFNAGLLSLASTTIGNGTQIGGLTINGGATSTLALNIASSTEGLLLNNVAAIQASTTLNNYYFGGATGVAENLGTYNYAIGQGALEYATSSSITDNFAVGYEALEGSTTTQNTGTDNNALGYKSLFSNITGSYDNAFGLDALYSNATGSDNNALGYAALYSNATGTDNNALGLAALAANTGGTDNNALGAYALYSNTTGTDNNALGYQALEVNTTGIDNNALGYSALYNNITGTNNNALGYGPLFSNTTGSNNNAFGNSALFYNITGTNNNALGYGPLFSNTTGSNNNAFGNSALFYNTTGTGNNALGFQTLYSNTTGDNNVGIGYQAGYNLTSGYSDIVLGDDSTGNAGPTTGYNEIALGSNIFFRNPATSNQLDIGNLLFGTLPATTTAFTLPTTGSIGIGTSSPFAELSIGANNGSTNTALFAIGSSTASATTTLFSISNTGTTTAANGFNITTGCFAVNGTCLSASGGGGGSGTVNSGTAGQFAFYNTTGTAVSGTSTIDLNTSTNELTFNTNLFNYADVSTTTIPNNDAYAWTIATSTTAEPLFAINTNSSSSSVSIGSPGSNIYIGDTNSSPNLIFQNSGQSIETASGGTINLGAGSDVINLGGSTTTASNGFNISAGCFAVGGNCLSNISLSGANTWIALQTFSGGASTTNISASGEGYFGTASTTNLYVSGTPNSILSTNSSGQVGALSVGSSLSFSSDTLSLNTSNANSWSAPQTFGSGLLSQASSTFTGSLNANGGLSVGGSATSTFADGINITAGCFSVNGTCLSASGGSSFSYLFPSNATSTTLTFNAGLLSLASTTIGNGTQIGGLTISGGATTTGNFLVQGNTTLASATSTNFAITNLANALLSTNGSGSVIASTSIGTNLLSGTLATINTTAITAGGTFTITAASSTLLGDNNTFSGTDDFTHLLIMTNGLLAIASSTIGNGTQIGGLTISGGATTTGSAYFGNNVGIGTEAPASALQVATDSSSEYSGAVSIGAGPFDGASPGYFSGTAAGTELAINATSSFTGNLADFQVGGQSLFDISNGGWADAMGFETQGSYNQAVYSGDPPYTSTSSTAASPIEGASYFWNQDPEDGGYQTMQLAATNGAGNVQTAYIGVVSSPTSTAAYTPAIVFGQQTGATSYQESMRIDSNGNVGIGTTSPGSLLSIGTTNGINFSTGTSTFSSTGGINLTSGCFSVNGTCLSASGGSSFSYLFPSNATSTTLTFNAGLLSLASTTIGNGTQIGGLTISGGATTTGNQIVSGTFSVTGLSTLGSLIDNASSTFIGNNLQTGGFGSFGTTTPHFGQLTVGTSTVPQLVLTDNIAADNLWTFRTISNSLYIASSTATATSSTPAFTINTSGSVGIGTSTPWGKLSITGPNTVITSAAFVAANSSNTPLFTVLDSGDVDIGTTTDNAFLSIQGYDTRQLFDVASSSGASTFHIASTGNIGLASTTPWAQLSINPNDISGPILAIGSTTATDLVISNGGFVGIGTTTPGSTLSLGSLANFTTATSTFYSSGGINLTGGCFAVNGTCLGGGSSASSTLLSDNNTFSGNDMFSNALTLGGGFLSQASSTVVGLLTLNGNLHITGSGNGITFPDGSIQTSASGGAGFGITSWTALNFQTGASINFQTGNGTATTTVLDISNAGLVGIGSSTPDQALAVNGNVEVSAGYCFMVADVCIGYVTKLQSIYATSTAGTSTVQFTGVQNGKPSWSAGTLTLPDNVSYYTVQIWGGGGGGGAELTNAGGVGTSTCYSQGSIACGGGSTEIAQANGGSGGTGGGNGGAGGGASLGEVNITGGAGAGNGQGGSAFEGGSGGGTGTSAATGDAGTAPGGGGGGGRTTSTFGGGGGAGGYSYNVVSTSVTTTSHVSIGAGGTGGTAGTEAGGAGGSGGIVITVYATSSPDAAGNDYAEMYPVSNPNVTAGDIVAVDTGTPVSLTFAQEGNNLPLAGVVSTAPGEVIGDTTDSGYRPIALAGRVPVNVNLQNGPINIGDRIAISSDPGVGMKAGPFDDSVGIALESYDGTGGTVEPDGSVQGTITVFVTLQQGIDINDIALGLLGNDPSIFNNPFATSTSATSTNATSTAPLDFVGGLMNALASRLDSFAFTPTTSSSTPDLTFSTSTASDDGYTSGFLQALFAQLEQWFASAGNGINDLFAGTIHTNEICVSDSTGSSTCIDKAQLDQLLADAAAAGNSASSSSSSSGQSSSDQSSSSGSSSSGSSSSPGTISTSSLPVLQVNGDNPATVQVGATYSDLGATILGPQPDLNLGIEASVDGATSTPISDVTIDTSQPGTYTITYSATDQNGLTGTATRTVNVVSADSATSAPQTSDASSTSSDSSTDTASSTPSTSDTSSSSSSNASSADTSPGSATSNDATSSDGTGSSSGGSSSQSGAADQSSASDTSSDPGSSASTTSGTSSTDTNSSTDAGSSSTDPSSSTSDATSTSS